MFKHNHSTFKFLSLLFLTVTLFACSSISFNEVSPLAKNFKPKAAIILPSIKMPDGVDFDADKIAKIFYDELNRTKKFERIVELTDAKATLANNQELQSHLLGYVTKLRTLNISDGELAKKIGEAYGVNAIFILEAGKWGYAKVLDEKTAEVSITVKLVDAPNGSIIWQASDSSQKSYSIFKPELTDMAQDVINKIIKHMPIAN